MRTWVAGGALVALAGCGGGLPTVGADEAAFGPSRGAAGFVVRTVAQAPSGADMEVGGVDCVAAADGFRTSFRSPARVVVPETAATAQGVRVSCAGGGRTGEAVAVPHARYGWDGATIWPSLGVSVTSGGRVGVGLGANVAPRPAPRGIGYGDVRVVLR